MHRAKLGTEFYMAPEVVKEVEHYTLAIDVWSFGCVLYEMRVGELTGLTTCKYVDYMADPIERSTSLSKDLKGVLGNILQFLPHQKCRVEDVTRHDFFTSGYCPQSLSWDIFEYTPSYSEENKRKLEETAKTVNYGLTPEQDDKRPRTMESDDGNQGGSPGEYVKATRDQSRTTEIQAMTSEDELAQEQFMAIETQDPRLDNDEIRSFLSRVGAARRLWINASQKLEEEDARMTALGHHLL